MKPAAPASRASSSGRGPKPGKWQLYDMAADRTELDNLAEKMPEKVAELSKAWNAWAKAASVYPKKAAAAK